MQRGITMILTKLSLQAECVIYLYHLNDGQQCSSSILRILWLRTTSHGHRVQAVHRP
jgi:hypothetical protein